MNTRIEEINNQIEQARRELEHLNDEKRALRNAEKDMSRQSYQREEKQINDHIIREQEKISNNETYLRNYESIREINSTLRTLRDQFRLESDSQRRAELNDQIVAQSEELQNLMRELPADLADEIRNNFLDQYENIEDVAMENDTENADTIVQDVPTDSTLDENTTDSSSVDTAEDTVEPEVDDAVYPIIPIDNTSDEYTVDLNNTAATDNTVEPEVDDVDIINSTVPTNDNNETNSNADTNNDEFIPGTNIRRPRERGPFESDEDYVDYLRNYYMQHFNNENNEEKQLPIPVGLQLPIPVRPLTPQSTPLVEPAEPQFNPPAVPYEPQFTPPVEPTEPQLPPSVEPVEPKPPQPPTIEEHTQGQPKRGLYEIIGIIRDGLDIEVKDGKRYNASNIKVSSQFKKELRSGNMLYNIVHVGPAVIHLATNFLRKLSGKLLTSKRNKENMETMRERINNLPPEDLETIFKEYRGSRVIQEKFPQAINIIIEEKMQEYILGKVTALNERITDDYETVLNLKNLIDSLDEELSREDLEPTRRANLENQRNEYLAQAGECIKNIRKNKISADNLLSGGLNGFSQDMKARLSKLNYVGMRFSKEHDLDRELEDQLVELEKQENRAIFENNNEQLLDAFLQSEMLLSNSTSINNSLFGRRSTGKKYYSPLAQQLDYRDDPFIRDIFTTLAISTAAISAANAIKTHLNQDPNAALKDFQNQYDQSVQQVRQYGKDITGERGTMYEGMSAQANQDTLNAANEVERATLDGTNWTFNSAYHTADHLGHDFFNGFHSQVQSQISEIANKYGSGAIDQAQALQEMAKVANSTQSTLANVTQQCLNVAKPYIQTHPQFDLSAIEQGMQTIVNNPAAIANMNDAIIKIDQVGENLISMTFPNVPPIVVPSDLGTTLLAAASSAALATKVASEMTANVRKGKYGNAVTQMMEEYSEQQNAPEEEETRRR